MKLVTKDIARKLPTLYSTEGVALPEKVAHVKLFHPVSSWTWYIIEYDGADTCFGLVIGHENEFGYFSLKELSQLRVLGLPIERDLHFRPMQVQDLPIYDAERVVA
jgi:hypothetical protein